MGAGPVGSVDRIRLGVVGLGAVAQSVHLPLIRRRWDLFELVAVADLSPSVRGLVGQQYGVADRRRYATLTEMLDGERCDDERGGGDSGGGAGLDGVILLTGGTHGPAVAECIRRGVPVFCEKPIAYSLAEVEEIQRLERGADRPLLLLAYMKEYDAATTRLGERLPAPADIRYVNVEVVHPSSAAQLAQANLLPARGDADPGLLARAIAETEAALDVALGPQARGDDAAAFRDLYGGVIQGSLIHDISLVRHLLGPIESIDFATQWAADADAGSIEVGARLSSAARLHLHWHYLPDYPRYRETVTIHHLRGTLELEFTVPYLLNTGTVLRVWSADGAGESVEVTRDVSEAFETELAAFHAMVTQHAAPPTGSAQGHADTLTGQRIARALAANLGIEISGEVGRPPATTG